MPRKAALRPGLLVGLCVLAVCRAQAPADRTERWRQDLKFFAKSFSAGGCSLRMRFSNLLTSYLPCHQADFAKLYSKPAFDAEIASLEAAAGDLSDAEIALRLSRLVASGHIGHTYVRLPMFGLVHRLPLQLNWYSDGLAVVAAAQPYTAALGARVLRVGSLTTEQLLAAVAPYISYENDTWLRQQSPGYLTMLEMLQHAGAAGTDGRAEFTLVKPGGEPFTLAVAPAGPDGWKLVNALDALRVPAALYRKQPGSYYWYEYLADSHALYIQYNRCQNDPKRPFGEFARGLFGFADGHQVERVVVDLRFNGGGNSRVIGPLIGGLKSRPALGSHVFVLIGPGTFSSAQDNAIDLRGKLHATLIGQATGAKPNGYGEVKVLTLPNSKLKVQYSTKYFRLMKHEDPSALEPDVPVGRTLEDALAGRDPALEAALRLAAPPKK